MKVKYIKSNSLKSTSNDRACWVKSMFILWNFLPCSVSIPLTSTLAIKNINSLSFCLGKSVNFCNNFSSPSWTEPVNLMPHLHPGGWKSFGFSPLRAQCAWRYWEVETAPLNLGSLVPTLSTKFVRTGVLYPAQTHPLFLHKANEPFSTSHPSNFYSTMQSSPSLFDKLILYVSDTASSPLSVLTASLASVGNLASFVKTFKTAVIRHDSIYLIDERSIGIVSPVPLHYSDSNFPEFTLELSPQQPSGRSCSEIFCFFGLNAYAGHSIKPTGTDGYILSIVCSQL